MLISNITYPPSGARIGACGTCWIFIFMLLKQVYIYNFMLAHWTSTNLQPFRRQGSHHPKSPTFQVTRWFRRSIYGRTAHFYRKCRGYTLVLHSALRVSEPGVGTDLNWLTDSRHRRHVFKLLSMNQTSSMIWRGYRYAKVYKYVYGV